MAIAALVLGIVANVISIIPFLGTLGGIGAFSWLCTWHYFRLYYAYSSSYGYCWRLSLCRWIY